MKTSITGFLFLSLGVLASCGGGGGGGTDDLAGGGPGPGSGKGTLTLVATDAPIDPRLIDYATIEVHKIRIHREVDGESGFITLYDGRPRTVELTALRNGLTNALTSGVLDAGTYSQIRLHCSDAYLRLKNGKEYSTQDGTIKLTSQDTSGFKIFLQPPAVIEEGVDTHVLLDFDVPKTFSPIPGNDIDNARLFHLHPLVRTAVISQSGEMRGAVTTREDDVRPVPASHAPVYVVLPGETDPENAIASTLSDTNGSAAILGVPPGRYDVLSVIGDRTGRQSGVVIGKGDVVSFEILVE